MVVRLGKCRRRWEEKDGGAEEEGMKVEGEGGRGNSAAGDLLQSGAAVSVRGAAACAEVNFVKLVIVAAAHHHLGDKRGRKRKGGVDKRRQGERADVVRRRGVWQGGCLYSSMAGWQGEACMAAGEGICSWQSQPSLFTRIASIFTVQSVLQIPPLFFLFSSANLNPTLEHR